MHTGPTQLFFKLIGRRIYVGNSEARKLSARQTESAIGRIEEAYWELFEFKEGQPITMEEVAALSGLPLEEVIASFPTPDSILKSIEDRQLAILEEIFNSTVRTTGQFSRTYRIFQKYYNENERYLEPLVIERRDNSFAQEYRAVLEDKLFQDLEVLMTKKDTHAVEILEFALSGFVEFFLIGISSYKLTDKDVEHLSDALMRHGYERELREGYGIVLGVMAKDE